QSSGFKKMDQQSSEMNSGSSSGSNQFSSIYKVSGTTILEAINKLQQIMGKELFFGYIRVIVIGDQAAKKDMDKIISFLYMSPRIRGSAYLLIANDTAYNTLGTVNLNDSDLSSKSLENILERSVRSGASFPIAISDYYNIVSTEGWEPVIPQVEYKRNNEVNDNQSAGNSYDPSIVPEQRGYHILKNMAVFKDNKKIGVLNEKETLCFGLITNKEIKSNYMITEDKKNNDEYFSGFRILHNKSEIKTQIKKDKLLVSVNIDIQASLEEYAKSKDLVDIEAIKDFERRLSEQIKKDIEQVINKVQLEYQSDIFGFGHKFFQQHTRQWNEEYKDQWDEIFPDVKTQVNANVKVLNTGSKVERIINK
ncbi:MAG: Ger(x)C family spore germination protein, partial [Clostridia bacterium]|nr:Ger(x)C family spore germination protein [Clostridia bacterium]